MLANFYFESRVLKIVESKDNDQQSERKTERTKCLVREVEGGNTLAPSPVSVDYHITSYWPEQNEALVRHPEDARAEGYLRPSSNVEPFMYLI